MTRALLLLAITAFSGAVLAEDDVSTGLSVGFGKAMIGSETCFDALLVAQELADRRWLATLMTHGDGVCREQEVPANIGFGLHRTVLLGKWSLGLGAQLWEHGDRAVGPDQDGDRPQLTAGIWLRRYLFHEHVTLDIGHSSTGGSTYYNPGRNLLTLSARF